MNINGTHGMYVVYVYGEGGGHLPSNWNGVVIMTFPIRRVMVHPPMERRICISCSLKKVVEINHEHIL